MAKVSVIGAGSWGTALALLLSKNGHDVTMWSILKMKSGCWIKSVSTNQSFRA